MTRFGARASVAAGVFSVLFTATIAAAAPPAVEGRAAALQALFDCRKLTEGPSRLACYDAATGFVEKAEASGDIVVVDREQARSVRRQGFGFNLPSLSIFDRGEKPEALDEVAARIEAVSRDRSGKLVLQIEGGQVWRQVDSGDLTRQPKPGMAVRIKRASLGSYMLSLEGTHSGIKVHRDD